MSLQHTSRLVRLFRPTAIRITYNTQRYTSSGKQPGQNVEGASGKTTDNAQPKILSSSPPKEGEQQDVDQHNKEMTQRAERPSEKVTDDDVEKDKVGKGFWGGK